MVTDEGLLAIAKAIDHLARNVGWIAAALWFVVIFCNSITVKLKKEKDESTN